MDTEILGTWGVNRAKLVAYAAGALAGTLLCKALGTFDSITLALRILREVHGVPDAAMQGALVVLIAPLVLPLRRVWAHAVAGFVVIPGVNIVTNIIVRAAG